MTGRSRIKLPFVVCGYCLFDGHVHVLTHVSQVVGGHSNEEEFDDVWTLGPDASAWVKKEPSGRVPRGRGGHTVVADPAHGLVVFGGISHERGGYLSDVQVLTPDLSAWQPVCATGELPCGRDKHSAVLAPGHRMLVYGGFGIQPPPDDDDEDEDEDEDKDDDEAKHGEAAVEGKRPESAGEPSEPKEEDEEGEEAGEGRGPSVDLGWFADVFALDLSTMRWTKLTTCGHAPPAAPAASSAAEGGGSGVWGALAKRAAAAQPRTPAARAAHACALLTLPGAAPAMVLFGGRAATGRLSDTWLLEGLDTPTPTWRQPELSGSAPSARSFHTCAAVIPGCVAVFGGLDVAGVHQNDLHLLHAAPSEAAWVRVRVAGIPPSPRASALIVCRAATAASGPSLLCFGGSANPSEHGDTSFHSDVHSLPLGPVLEALATATATPAGEPAEEAAAAGEELEARHEGKKVKLAHASEAAKEQVGNEQPPSAEAAAATPVPPAAPPVAFDFSKIPALEPRTGGIA